MTQEQITTLKNEIVSLNKQVDILNSADFADTVPEIETAKTAIKNYIQKAQAEIDKFEAEHAPKTVKIEGIEGLEELLKNPIVKQILELFLNGLKNLNKQQSDTKKSKVQGLHNSGFFLYYSYQRCC